VDASQLALIVAGIAGFSGIVQGIVQATVASRATRVTARQEAIKAELAPLQALATETAAMGQAMNAYMLEAANRDFYEEEQWELRGPLLHDALRHHGNALILIHSLPARSSLRQAVTKATDMAGDVLRDPQPILGGRNPVIQQWTDESVFIREAIEALGAAQRRQLVRLEDVTRSGLSRAVRRILHQEPTEHP
jgi:hypothetical protein